MRLAFFFKSQPSFERLISPRSSTGNSRIASSRLRWLASTALRTVVGVEHKHGMPLSHQTAEGISIGIVADLFQQRRCRIGMPEPRRRIPAIVRPRATVSDNAVHSSARRTCLRHALNHGRRRSQRYAGMVLLAWLGVCCLPRDTPERTEDRAAVKLMPASDEYTAENANRSREPDPAPASDVARG